MNTIINFHAIDSKNQNQEPPMTANQCKNNKTFNKKK